MTNFPLVADLPLPYFWLTAWWQPPFPFPVGIDPAVNKSDGQISGPCQTSTR